MRMFVAVEPDETTRSIAVEEQRRAQQRLQNTSLRLVDPKQIHLTLAFLGEVASPLVNQVIDAMHQPFAGVAPFRLELGGLGTFPPRGAPRVLWLGLSSGAREVIALQSMVATRLAALGVTLDDRDFHPHFTIGRWRHARPSDRPETRPHVPGRSAMVVDRVTLFESRLSSEGARHVPLAHACLSSTP